MRNFATHKGVGVADLGGEPLFVKVEGDGCVVSRKSAWTTLPFVPIDSGRQLQSPRLHRLLAVVECSENYLHIKETLSDLHEEVNLI